MSDTLKAAVIQAAATIYAAHLNTAIPKTIDEAYSDARWLLYLELRSQRREAMPDHVESAPEAEAA